MQKHIIGSAAFHVAVFVVGYVSLPAFRDDLPPLETPIIVDVIEVGEITNVPPAQRTPVPKQEPEKAAPPPPPPPPQAKAPPPPPPAEKQVAVLPPEPAPKPEAKLPEPKPEPKPESKPAPKVPDSLANAKPMKKPKAPDDFASVLRTVENLKPQPQAKKEPEPKKEPAKKPEPKETFDAAVAKALASNTTKFNPNQRVTISEIDLVRNQLRECWNLPAGAKGVESIVTDIRVWMNPDGTVQKAEIQNALRVNTDPYYRAIAEAALRAVLNPRCQPFKLPRDKFNEWRDLTLAFDPREMF